MTRLVTAIAHPVAFVLLVLLFLPLLAARALNPTLRCKVIATLTLGTCDSRGSRANSFEAIVGSMVLTFAMGARSLVCGPIRAV